MKNERFCNFSIRVSKHEYELIKHAAKADRRSMADFIRLSVFDKIADKSSGNGVTVVTKRVSGLDRTSVL